MLLLFEPTTMLSSSESNAAGEAISLKLIFSLDCVGVDVSVPVGVVVDCVELVVYAEFVASDCSPVTEAVADKSSLDLPALITHCGSSNISAVLLLPLSSLTFLSERTKRKHPKYR